MITQLKHVELGISVNGELLAQNIRSRNTLPALLLVLARHLEGVLYQLTPKRSHSGRLSFLLTTSFNIFLQFTKDPLGKTEFRVHLFS